MSLTIEPASNGGALISDGMGNSIVILDEEFQMVIDALKDNQRLLDSNEQRQQDLRLWQRWHNDNPPHPAPR